MGKVSVEDIRKAIRVIEKAREELEEEELLKAKGEDDTETTETKTDKTFDAEGGLSEKAGKGIETVETATETSEDVTTHGADVSPNAPLRQEPEVMRSSVNDDLVKSIRSTKKLLKSLLEDNKLLRKRLRKIEKTVESFAEAPARGKKSVTGWVEKSFSGTGGESLDKSQVLDVLVNLAAKNKIDPLEVTKYESEGIMSPEVEKLVRSEIEIKKTRKEVKKNYEDGVHERL